MSNELSILNVCIKDPVFFLDNIITIRQFLAHKDYYMHIINSIESCIDNGVTVNRDAIINEIYKLKSSDKVAVVVLDKVFASETDTDKSVILELLEIEYTKRQIDSMQSSLTILKQSKAKISEFLGHLETAVDSVTGLIDSGVHVDQAFDMYIDEISSDDSNVMLTGIKTLDYAIGGIRRVDLYAICADTGQGKTILMYQIADNLAKLGYRVGFYTLEMAVTDLVERIVTRTTRQPINIIKMKKSNREKHIEVSNKVKDYYKEKNINLFFHDSFYTFLDIKASIKQMQYDIVFIDYWQLMNYGGNEKFQNRQLELNEISRMSKLFCKKNKIPIFYNVQLASMKVKAQPLNVPEKGCIRDSTSIANDASNVLFIYRPDQYGVETFNNCDTKDKVWLINGKSRGLPVSMVKMDFDKKGLKFDDIKEEIDELKKKIM